MIFCLTATLLINASAGQIFSDDDVDAQIISDEIFVACTDTDCVPDVSCAVTGW